MQDTDNAATRRSRHIRSDIAPYFAVPRWVLGVLKPRDLLVYIALKSFCDDDLKCFPCVETITERSGLSRASVIRSIKALRSMDIITVESRRRANGSQTSCVYTVRHNPPQQFQQSITETLCTPQQSITETLCIEPSRVSQRHPHNENHFYYQKPLSDAIEKDFSSELGVDEPSSRVDDEQTVTSESLLGDQQADTRGNLLVNSLSPMTVCPEANQRWWDNEQDKDLKEIVENLAVFEPFYEDLKANPIKRRESLMRIIQKHKDENRSIDWLISLSLRIGEWHQANSQKTKNRMPVLVLSQWMQRDIERCPKQAPKPVQPASESKPLVMVGVDGGVVQPVTRRRRNA